MSAAVIRSTLVADRLSPGDAVVWQGIYHKKTLLTRHRQGRVVARES